jgi:hypothetical protein
MATAKVPPFAVSLAAPGPRSSRQAAWTAVSRRFRGGRRHRAQGRPRRPQRPPGPAAASRRSRGVGCPNVPRFAVIAFRGAPRRLVAHRPPRRRLAAGPMYHRLPSRPAPGWRLTRHESAPRAASRPMYRRSPSEKRLTASEGTSPFSHAKPLPERCCAACRKWPDGKRGYIRSSTRRQARVPLTANEGTSIRFYAACRAGFGLAQAESGFGTLKRSKLLG